MQKRIRVLAVRSTIAAALTVLPQYAYGQTSCPALPGNKSFSEQFISILTGGSNRSPIKSTGNPVKQLNKTQQEKVLSWLRDELENRRTALATERQADEAADRLKKLRQRIFTIDRINRDPKLVNLRLFDRKDDKARPASGRGKPLGQIIDDEIKKATPSLASKYGAKYRQALTGIVIKDAEKVGETLGALSAGDYRSVMDQAASWGAAGFGTIISDLLSEVDPDSKAMWDVVAARAGTAKTVLIALNQGRPDDAWKAVVDQYKADVKAQAQNLAKLAINWVFDAGNGPPKLGDFVPLSSATQNVIGSGLFSLTPGDVYLKLIDAEIALINWGKKYARKKSDGECIQKYVDVYNASGSTSKAFEEFDLCTVTRPPLQRYSALWEFRNQSSSIGMNYDTAIKKFLEAHRRGLPGSATPLEWIAAQVKAKREAMQRLALPKLTRAEKVMANIAKAAGKAMDNRLTELAAAVLNEKQWEALEKDIRALEQALAKTMAAVQKDLARLRRYSDVIAKDCSTYDKNKTFALAALREGAALSVKSWAILDKLRAIDVSVCTKKNPAASGQPGAKPSDTLQQQMAQLAASGRTLSTLTNDVCAAPDAIKSAANKSAARDVLNKGLRKAGEVRKLAATLKASANKLVQAIATANKENNVKKIAALKKQLNGIGSEITALASQFASLRSSKFEPAWNAMNAAQKRARNLADPTNAIIKNVRACIRPLADAPAARGPRKLLEEFSDRRGSNLYCSERLKQSWEVRDRDPTNAAGTPVSSTPWSRRKLDLTISTGRLKSQLAQLQGKCASVPAPAAIPSLADVAKIVADTEKTLGRMQTCVAQTVLAYHDKWGKVSLDAPTCNVSKNNRLQQNLQRAAQDGSQEAKDHLAKITPVLARVALLHATYSRAQARFRAGDLAQAKRLLSDAQTTISKLGGTPDCSNVSNAIATANANIQRLERLIAAAKSSTLSCDGTSLAQLQKLNPNVSHPLLNTLFAMSSRMNQANTLFNEANTAYKAGNLDTAESRLKQVKSTLSNIASQYCTALLQRADNGLARIARLRDAIAKADEAIKQCNMAHVSYWQRRFAGVSNPAATTIKAKLQSAPGDCKSVLITRANGRCKASFGTQSEAIPATVGQTQLRCRCTGGYRWNQTRTRCVRPPTAQEIAGQRTAACKAKYGAGYLLGAVLPDGRYFCRPTQATADRKCRERNGSGYYATAISDRGGFSCRPTQARADQLCNQRNPGTGWRARNITPTGQYSCYQDAAARRQAALTRCRQRHGSQFLRLDQRADGGFSCRFCNPGYYPRGGRCVITSAQATANCRAKYGFRFLRIIPNANGYSCRYCNPGYLPRGGRCVITAAQATANCRARHGAQFLRIVPNANGYACRYCRPGSFPRNGRCVTAFAQTVANCRARYGTQFLRVERRGNRYVCRFCNRGFVPRGGRCQRIGRPPVSPGGGGPVRSATCNSAVKQGGNRPETVVVNLGRFSGRASFSYNMVTIPDRMIVYAGRRAIYDTGCVSGRRKQYFNIAPGTGRLTVVVQPNCRRRSTTQWSFRFKCPD